MSILVKLGLALFLVSWIAFAGWMVWRYATLFGPHSDDPAETPGARSFGVAHIIAVWLGVFALTVYFLFIR